MDAHKGVYLRQYGRELLTIVNNKRRRDHQAHCLLIACVHACTHTYTHRNNQIFLSTIVSIDDEYDHNTHS